MSIIYKILTIEKEYSCSNVRIFIIPEKVQILIDYYYFPRQGFAV